MNRIFKKLTEFIPIIILILMICSLFFNFFVKGSVLYREDITSYFYPIISTLYEMGQNAKLTYWNPYIYSGFPQIGDFETNAFYPFSFIYYIIKTPYAITLFIIIHMILSATGMYLFLRNRNKSIFISTTGSLIYILSGFFISETRHPVIMASTSYIPYLLLLYEKYIREKINSLFYISFSALCWGFQMITFPSIAFMTLIFYFFWVIFDFLFSEKKNISIFIKSIIFTFCSIFIGFGITAVQMLQSIKFNDYNMRMMLNNEHLLRFSRTFSLELNMIPPLFFPEFFNRIDSLNNYMFYIGSLCTISLMISVAYIIWKRKSGLYPLLILLLMTFLIALGEKGFLNDLFIYLLPKYKLFRSSVRFIVFFTFLTAIIISYLMEFIENRYNKLVLYTISFLIIAELFILGIKSIDLIDSMYFSGVGVYRDITYNNKKIFPPRMGLHLPTCITNLTIPSHISNIMGYNPLMLNYYFEYIFHNENGYFPDQEALLNSLNEANRSVFNAIDTNMTKLLDVQYYVNRNPVSQKLQGFLIDQKKNYRYFVTGDYDVIPQKDKLLKKLNDIKFDPMSKLLFLEDPNKPRTKNKIESVIKPVSFDNDRIQMYVSVSEPCFLFLSEIYYPDWKCYVDGKKVEVLRADYVFRSVYLEKGKHNVVFIFKPDNFMFGATITVLSYILVAVLIIIGMYNGGRHLD